MVAHRDRLARFGFELIEWLVQQNAFLVPEQGGQVLVLHQPDASPQSELTEDLLAVLHTFSCRMHGLRRYRTAIGRIQVYPNQVQKRAIASWLDASRWTYNLSVELRRAGAPAAWRTVAKTVMSELDSQRPEGRSVPYQIKRTSVRDACRAMQNVKAFNAQLAQDKAAGCRLDEDFAELGFRSRKNPRRKNPRQSGYIPRDLVRKGLRVEGLDPDGVATAIAYQSRRRALSLVDCFALALAHHHGHTLLREDRRMRAFAQDEGIPHHDLLWIIDHMHQAAILTISQVVAALEAMHEDPRCPVPKQELARRLRSLNE